jgi:hypothetical protein
MMAKEEIKLIEEESGNDLIHLSQHLRDLRLLNLKAFAREREDHSEC